MAWHRTIVSIGGVSVEGFIAHDPEPRVDIPYRDGIGHGAKVTAAGLRGDHRVKALRNPGGRNERLELVLEPAPRPAEIGVDGPKRRKRRPGAKARAGDGK